MPDSTERQILGMMLYEPECVSSVLELVKSDYFVDARNRRIFTKIINFTEQNKPIEVTALDPKGEDRIFLLELLESITSTTNLEYYCKQLKERYIRGQLVDCCRETIGKIETEDFEETIDRFESRVFSLAEQNIRGRSYSMDEVLPEVHSAILDGKQDGLKTGFYDIDRLIGGFSPGDFVVIAARPSVGKTAFCLSMMRHWAMNGIPSAIITLETTNHQIVNRLLAAHARINVMRVRTGQLTNAEKEGLSGVCAEMSPWPIYIDDSPSPTTVQLKARTRRLVAKHHPKVLIIDYLQLLHASHRCNSRNDEVSEISRTLRELPKELDIPVIAISQLSRKTEQREDKRPGLSDLRDSGTIEQDATAVLLLWRPEMYKVKTLPDGTPTENLAICDLIKQKDGPTGEVKLTFLKDFTLFENRSDYSGEPYA